MRDYTVLRLDVDVGPAARVLRKVPGVAVGGEQAESADTAEGVPRRDESPRASTGETPPPSEPDGSVALEAEDGEAGEASGLKDRLPPVVREWGLLVVGVLFLLVGVASAVLWAVKRRKESGGEDTDGEFPEVDSFDEPVDEWRPDDGSSSRGGGEDGSDDGTERESVTEPETGTAETAEATVLGAEPMDDGVTAQVDTGAPSASEDRSELDAAPDAPSAGDDEESGSPAEHEAESIDVAPLLGMGFLAVVAAVAKWAQRESVDETPVR